MAEKTEFKASANVAVTIEVQNIGPYGEGCTADKIHDQTAREAVQELERLIMEGQKASPGGHRVRIVGEPVVTIVSARRSK